MSDNHKNQRQDSLNDQLHDLAREATRLGMYDAADFLAKFYDDKHNPRIMKTDTETMSDKTKYKFDLIL
jgi:hypothetical protein